VYADVSPIEQFPQIAAVAHGRQWIAFANPQGVRQPPLYPQQLVQLVAATHPQSLGQTQIRGVTAYGFKSAVAPAQLNATNASSATATVYLAATGQPVRVATSIQNPPNVSPAVVLMVEDITTIKTPVLVSPPPAAQTQPITSTQARALHLIP
jgi:hypothetical protein